MQSQAQEHKSPIFSRSCLQSFSEVVIAIFLSQALSNRAIRDAEKSNGQFLFPCLSNTSFVICVQLSIVLHIFRVYFYNSLHVIIFLSNICSCFQRFLMFLTISHVFAAMFSFCALVSDFPMESWSCCHGGQTQISRPKNLKYIFINIEICNQMLICRIDTEMYILTKIFSRICAI